jgi:hypothetical protein
MYGYIYVCFIYIQQGGWCGRQGIWMIHIVEEIKLLLLPGNYSFEVSDFNKTWYTYDYNIGINKYPGNAGEIS